MVHRQLAEYPRPHVAADLVALTVLGTGTKRELGVVVVRREGVRPALPGRLVRHRHTIERTVHELLDGELSFRPRRRLGLTMLGVYDDPDRDGRGWVMSVAYATVVSPTEAAAMVAGGGEILPLHGSAARGHRVTAEQLAYDHDHMVATAVRRARRRYERVPDPFGLIRPPYTLTQLRRVHEAVLDEALRRDTFNRRMKEYLEPARDRDGREMHTVETVGRPAQLFVPARRARRGADAGPFPLPRAD